MTPICFITQPVHPDGVARLQAAGIAVRFASSSAMDVVCREIGDADAVITRDAGLNAAAMRSAPALRLIASHGVGIDRVDLAQAGRQGIVVTNTPDTNVRSVAEYTIGLMLALARRIMEADQAVRRGDWGFRHASGMMELRGKRLGLAGFGAIAREVARIAQAGLGMEVAVWSPSAPAERFAGLPLIRTISLQELLSQSDVISLHRPLRDDTANMIDDDALRTIKPGALLINTGRGGLIDTAALRRGLEDGRVGAAALDVFDSEPPDSDGPVMHMPRTILTPHIGGTTQEALSATARLCADQVIAVLDGRIPPHAVATR